MSEISFDLESIAIKILEILEKLHPEESVTAWDLKFKLKVALSPLYLALGKLQERGRIRIVADGLTYRIESTSLNRIAQSVIGVPIQIPVPIGEGASSKGNS